MKRCGIHFVMVVFAFPFTLFAQGESQNLLKNGDFEKFTGDNPVGWETTNVPGLLTVVSASKVFKGGARAVRCEVKDCFGSRIAGMVCQKNVEITGEEVKLSGHYVLHSEGNDKALLLICFVSSEGSTLETVEEYLTLNKPEFSSFSKVAKIPNGAERAHIRLTLVADKQSGKLHEGSYVIFDDVKLVALLPRGKSFIP
ncbi:MAG TPA: hypothetical protein DCP63_13090 [Bacteroidetes bacterium]|nr:hypothetical protein [Bacteroidota bacterium]